MVNGAVTTKKHGYALFLVAFCLLLGMMCFADKGKRMLLRSDVMDWHAVPLRADQLPKWFKHLDPNEGDVNGPFLVINGTGDVLDRRNYCQWRAPRFGDGYSDSRSDYDFSPEYVAQQDVMRKTNA